MLQNRYLIGLFALLGFVVLIWWSLFTGAKDIRFLDLFTDPEKLLVFGISRVPRTLALILVGAGIGIAGFVMQQISQNKFVSPTTAGSLDAAKMGILFSLILIPNASLGTRMGFSMLFTFFAALLFIVFINKIKVKSTVFIPLIGIMYGSILGSVSTFFAYKQGIVQNTQEWLLGDFSAVIQGQYETIYLILPGVLLMYVYADKFTIAGLGESFAKNLGLSYNAVIYLGLFLVSLVVSASMVTVGAIPFVGLIIPNLVSILFGDHLRRVLPVIACVGAIFLIICDLAGRLLVYPYEIPIGMTVGVIGSLTFLIMIFRKRG